MLQSLRGHHSAKQLTNLKNVSEGGGRRFLWLCCQISGLQEYTDAENEKQRPIMIHRAVFGSIERFFGILVENFAGAFPLWLAPVQVGNPPPPPHVCLIVSWCSTVSQKGQNVYSLAHIHAFTRRYSIPEGGGG